MGKLTAASARAQLLTVACTVVLMVHVQLVASHGSMQLTYIVPRKEKTCFSKVWIDSEKIFFEYQVLRGGQKDLDVQIITPNGMMLYDKQRASNDEVTFTPQNGEFRFCFSNEFSQLTDKVVTFNIRSAFTNSLSQETGDSEPIVKGSSETSCDVIHEATSAILDFQDCWRMLQSGQTAQNKNEILIYDGKEYAERKYRIRESIGRHLAEQLNQMVSWWSLGQSLVVLVCGVGQVLALRTFFTDKRQSSKPAEGEPEERQVTSYT